MQGFNPCLYRRVSDTLHYRILQRLSKQDDSDEVDICVLQVEFKAPTRFHYHRFWERDGKELESFTTLYMTPTVPGKSRLVLVRCRFWLRLLLLGIAPTRC
jgi:hypothetical protein